MADYLMQITTTNPDGSVYKREIVKAESIHAMHRVLEGKGFQRMGSFLAGRDAQGRSVLATRPAFTPAVELAPLRVGSIKPLPNARPRSPLGGRKGAGV